MSKEKIVMASADFCGFSKKMEKQLLDEKKIDDFEIYHCDIDKTPKALLACAGVNGFPTFKKKLTTKTKGEEDKITLEECSVGFGDTAGIESKCK